MEKLKTKLLKPWFAYTFAACSAVLLYAVLWHLPSVAHAIRSAMNFLSPVIIGAVTAYLFNPVSCFFERKMLKKMKSESGRHTLGVIITIICVVLVLVLLLVALIPSLVKSVSKLVTNWDSYIEKLDNLFFRIEALAHRIGINISISNISSLVEGSLDKLVDFVKNNTNTVLKTAGSIGSDVTNIALGLVFGFCFLAAKKAILDFILKIRYAFVDKEKAEQ
ncbi:MAG: AI-2E family transporter, partial [Clostridia bacterium]|nr:AI-2E family transporter [Clostridia bacterium]